MYPLRFFAAKYAKGSAWHTDANRGHTVQLIMALDEGYALEVRFLEMRFRMRGEGLGLGLGFGWENEHKKWFRCLHGR